MVYLLLSIYYAATDAASAAAVAARLGIVINFGVDDTEVDIVDTDDVVDTDAVDDGIDVDLGVDFSFLRECTIFCCCCDAVTDNIAVDNRFNP